MIKKFLCILFAAALVAAAGAALAADDVATTKHNLSTSGTGTYKLSTGTDQTCVFCHSPHTEAGAVPPLWNRKTDSTGYTKYTSPTINMTIAAAPTTVSLACLSCHDGVIAFDQLINGPGSGDYDATGASRLWAFTAAGNKIGAGVTLIGKTLTGDHPVSVTYDTTLDTAFNAAASGKVGSLPLYGASSNQVECASCHDPHDKTNAPFLRISNAASALCKTCHIK